MTNTPVMTPVRPALATVVQGLEAALMYNNTLVTFRENEVLDKGWDGVLILNLDALPKDRPLLIGVHSGDAHADDVCCLALMMTLIPQEYIPHGIAFIRTRDTELLATCDLRFDVGEGWGDHHGARMSPGVAACTRCFQMLYQTFAGIYPKQLWLALANIVDDIAALDCGDTDVNKFGYVNAAWAAHRCTAKPDENADVVEHALFKRLACQMRDYFNDVCTVAVAAAEAEAAAQKCIDEHTSNGVTVFDAESRNADGKKMLYDQKVNAFFYVSPQSPTDWRVLCAANPDTAYAFNNSWYLIPEKYRGLRDSALADATGLQDAIFVHAAGFIGGFGSRESAVAFAERCALECGWQA